MLCRALLTVIAVSYLICVLILSGLQKEDLDVNMLKKLGRHGLDIEDINNESLRVECLKTAKTTDKTPIKTAQPISATSLPQEMKTEMNTQPNELNKIDKTKPELRSIVKYFMDLQNSQNKSNTENVNDSTTKINTYNIPQSSNLRYIFSDMIGYNAPDNDKKDLQTSTDAIFHLFSKDILKLWNTYRHDTIESTTKPTTLQTPTSITIGIQNDTGSEIDILNKILAQYFSKNLLISTTTQLPQREELDLTSLTEEFRRYLANARNATKHNIKNKPNPQINVVVNKTQHDFTKETKNTSDLIPPLEGKTIVKDFFKNKPTLPSKIQVKAQEEINDPHVGLKNMQTKVTIPIENTENIKLLQDDKIFKNINNFYGNMEKSNHPEQNYKPLPSDIIKEIADSVKAMVLQDLRKEILTKMPIVTSTTTEIPSTFKPSQEKKIEATHMMEKFMELFQQFKTTKEKTITAGNSQVKVTEKKDVRHEYKGPVKVIYSPHTPPLSPYGVRSPAAQIAPIFVKHYNNEPRLNAPKYIVVPSIQNPVYQVQQIDNIQTGLRLTPITIQTNSFEVPPLGVPIEKPLSMVNQNIIVTTNSPNLRPRLDSHHTNYIHHIDRYKIGEDFRTRNNWQKPVPNPTREFQQYVKDDTNMFDEHDNLKVKISDRSHFDRYNNKDYDRNYKPHYTKPDYDHMKHRNPEMKRFHERLENTDENTEEREGCCKARVASRQQLPLSSVKKRSKYDDVHFRNFLKTQQKVNDMLEKILATKTKSDGPRSVETT